MENRRVGGREGWRVGGRERWRKGGWEIGIDCRRERWRVGEREAEGVMERCCIIPCFQLFNF